MRLPFTPTDGLCRRCGRAAVGLDGEFLCDDCRTHRPAFDRAASVFRFENEARELVNAFKFRDCIHLRADFADCLEGLARVRFRLGDVACVVPMPTTVPHRWLRGYNQSDMLARALAKRLRLPCRALLRRTGNPRRQGTLCEEDRRTNVIGTFAVSARPRIRAGCTLLVVDDIMTTGSTLSEAAKTLKSAGAGTVWTITLARSLRDS